MKTIFRDKGSGGGGVKCVNKKAYFITAKLLSLLQWFHYNFIKGIFQMISDLNHPDIFDHILCGSKSTDT